MKNKFVEPALLHNKTGSEQLFTAAVALLRQLIATPSFSREENATASLIRIFLESKGIRVLTKHNNVWCLNKYFDPKLPSVLLNSHHDTVKPDPGYTRDPFVPAIEGDKLYGLGSNDAGAARVSLLMSFLFFNEKQGMKFNLIFAATAEEEISGVNGIESIIPGLGPIELAVIGEPTSMDLAIAEKGLMVLDCTVRGTAGHAAHDTGDNAIYKALREIEWFRTHSFGATSRLLGPVRMSVTVIRAGTQHNVVPGICEFTVDVRTTDAMSNEEVLAIIKKTCACEVHPRSLRLKPSSISQDHPFVQAGLDLGCRTYGSPTISDQALLSCPSVKIGPGDSKRSHTADEFILLSEIKEGIDRYIKILEKYLTNES